MAFTEGSSDGALNGTTEVTLVAAPSSGVRRLVKTLVVHNRDTAAVTLTIRLKNGINTRQIWKGTLASLDSLALSWMIILDSTSKSLAAVLSGAPATTNPDFLTSYGDAS